MCKSGFLLIDKEEGMTSRFVDNKVGFLFGTKRVGHLGTLDPFATGLLLVAVNKATKFLPYIVDDRKIYEATLLLGVRTDSGDKDGKPLEEKPILPFAEEDISRVFLSFLGKQKQLPPLRSAIKVNGKPLYKYAIEKKEVSIKEREVCIHSLKLLSFDERSIRFEATVSKGTYIRSLGEDIASRLGTVGHLTSLRRLADGDISVLNAKRLSDISYEDLMDPASFISLPSFALSQREWEKVKNGCKIHLDLADEKVLLVHEGKAMFVYRKCGEGLFEAERGLF